MVRRIKILNARPAASGRKDNGGTERVSREQDELRITQDVNPSGLGLMPGWMAQRIAELFSPSASGHA